jgi:hypothetical protein
VIHGVDIPEFNAAPVLWRAVREFHGPRKYIDVAIAIIH